MAFCNSARPASLVSRSGRSVLVALVLASAVAVAQPAIGEERSGSGLASEPVLDEAFFGFGGAYIAGYFNDLYRHPFDNDYYGDVIAGFGYQKFFAVDPDGLSYGVEIGAGARFGVSAPSAEVWTGGVVRYDGVELFEKLRVTPAVTVGFSYVTGKTQTEVAREAGSGDSATFLFYLAPEIGVSLVEHPDWEMFARIQHRSGLYGTLANIDGANALTFGVRHRF